jgi:D-alanyl-D-alanine carboxypeptidase
VFPWWSFTKTAIAVCALKSAQAGLIDLDKALTGQPYTLRQLLQHRAGVPNYSDDATYLRCASETGCAPWSPNDLLERTKASDLFFPPGQGWRYSNTGYLIVRQFLEHLSGQSLAKILEAQLFEPLGLRSAFLAENGPDFDGVHWDNRHGYHPGWVYHGCIVGTAQDAAVLLHKVFTGDMLSPAMLAEMLNIHPLGGPLEGWAWLSTGYGLGIMSGDLAPAGTARGHSGAGPFCTNAVYHFPDLQVPVTVAVFTEGPDEAQAELMAAELAIC